MRGQKVVGLLAIGGWLNTIRMIGWNMNLLFKPCV